MTVTRRIWLPLALGLVGLAGCSPPSPAQQAAAAAQAQTGPSIIDMQLSTPPAPGAPAMSGPEASAIWRHYLTQLASGRGGGGQGGSQADGGAAGGAGGAAAGGMPGGGSGTP